MPVTLHFAQQVISLCHLADVEIAIELRCDVAEVAEARRMLALPTVDDDPEPPRPHPTEAERQANFERMPRSWQDRNRRH